VYIYRFAYIFALFTLPTHTESKTAFEVEVFFACPGRQTAVRQSVRPSVGSVVRPWVRCPLAWMAECATVGSSCRLVMTWQWPSESRLNANKLYSLLERGIGRGENLSLLQNVL